MKDKSTKADILRQKAEELLEKKSVIGIEKKPDIEILKLIHEIDVHQIELELQNEELVLAKNKAENDAEKYTNLYDFAPSGYFTLTKDGEIIELNFIGANLLGKERSLLLNNRFILFASDKSKPTFKVFLEELFETKTRQTCEIILTGVSNIPTYVYLTGIVPDNEDKCLVTMIDISKQKKAEENLLKSQLLLQSTLESQNETLIFSIDTNYNYLTFNNYHSAIMKLAYNATIKVGMNILECISSIEDRKVAKDNFDRALKGESHSNIRVFGDVEKAHYESFFNPIVDNNNKVIGLTGLARDITTRVQDQENQKASEEKYRHLFETNRDSITIFRINSDGNPGNFIEVNPAATTLFGYTKNELLELNIFDVENVSDEMKKERLASLLHEGKINFETTIKNKNGNLRNVEIKTQIINFLDEPAVMNITRDITERVQIEKNAKKAQDNLITILEAIPDMLFEVNQNGKIKYYQSHLQDLLSVPDNEIIGKRLQEVFPAYAAKVYFDALQEADENGWSSGKEYSLDLTQGKCWFELSVSLIKESNFLDKHFIILARDITKRKVAEDKIRVEKERIRTILELVGSPIFLKDNDHRITYANSAFYNLFSLDEKSVIGKALVENVPKDEMEHFLKIDRDVLDTGISDSREEKLTVNGIEQTIITRKTRFIDESGNKSLVGSIYDITERKLAEKALENEKRRLDVILLGTGAGTWEWNIQTGETIFNEQWANIIGYTLEEIAPVTIETWKKYTHPDDLKHSQEILEKHFQGNQDFYECEFRMKHKNGDWIWVIARGRINEWDVDGKPLYMSGTNLDITERKLAEQKLIESEKLLNETQFIANMGSYSLDFNSGKWKSSAAIDKISGIDSSYDKTIEGLIKIIHPDWQTIMIDYFNNEIFTKKSSFNKEYKIIKIDTQEERWVHGNGELICNQQGEIQQLIGTIQDITERKLIDEELKIASEKLKDLVNSTEGIVWEADAMTVNFTYVSKQAERLLGFSVEEWYTEGFWANHLHPDDKNKAISYCTAQTKQMLAHDFSYRFISKEGKTIWLRDIVTVVVEDGKPRWLRGVMFDITHLKENEISLRESEEKYRALVENSPDGVVIYVDDKIAFVNEVGVRMLRAKDKNELIGKPVLQFVHPESLEDISKRMKDVVTDNYISTSVEAKFIRIDGTPFDVEVKGIPTLYERKKAVQIIVHDITLRKQNTLELNKINRVYALISQINNLIIRTHNRQELFQEICNIAVNFGKFRMSWIGLLNENHKIITAAFAGHEEGYFTKSNITTVLDVPEGRGPTGIALREGRTVICNDIANDPMMKPWRKDALERGYSSVISIPIIVRNTKIGAFNLYSQETNFFSSEEEISLLEKIILNIAFALESILVEEDRKQTEEKIRQLSQAVEQSPVTIVISNTNGDIEYVNSKFIETTGYTLEEVLGKNPRVLKSGYTSLKEYQELWKTLDAGKEWHGEFHNKRKDGSLYWESATISPILNAEGKITHYIAIKEDITHRKIVEKELVKSKERAEESDRLKLVFLANMSHEIRTPMNGILGFTELLKEPKLTGEEQQEYISIIEKSGKRMLNIINDIISISKIESGQIEISQTETNVNEQLKYIQTFFQPEAKQKGIQLTILKKLAAKDNLIKTDREKVYAVLTNLVKNALKFTNEGAIEFGCEKKGGYLEFFVKDTGLGISKSQKKIIFERFRQANETISRAHEGSGLGLAISKAYIEMLGGKIWVESKQGKGSTFYFTIPLNSDNELEEKDLIEKAVSVVKEGTTIKNLKVLIVEDDAISKLLITIAIKPYSKEILKVSNGIEAVEACRSNPDIDLVMMDINMPKMDGYEATKLIREFNKDLIIIAQTANGMQSDRDNAIEAGCTDYISKPINITDLGALIQKYFN